MNVIIAGSRDITLSPIIMDFFVQRSGITVDSVICGMARGMDLSGRLWAVHKNIPVIEMPANWDTFGKSAGYRRNQAMADCADALILIWDGESRGSGHMRDIALAKKLPIYEVILREYIHKGDIVESS